MSQAATGAWDISTLTDRNRPATMTTAARTHHRPPCRGTVDGGAIRIFEGASCLSRTRSLPLSRSSGRHLARPGPPLPTGKAGSGTTETDRQHRRPTSIPDPPRSAPAKDFHALPAGSGRRATRAHTVGTRTGRAHQVSTDATSPGSDSRKRRRNSLCVLTRRPSSPQWRRRLRPVSSSRFEGGFELPLTMACSGGVRISRKHERQIVPSAERTPALKPIRPSSKSAIVESPVFRPQRRSKR